MTDRGLLERVRREAGSAAPPEERAQRIAELIRLHTGRRWVGIYRVDAGEVVNLAWSGSAAPAYPRFSADQGLSGEAIRSRNAVISNDVASDSRYLTALETTGSELIVPVVADGEVVGTLDVEDARIGAFGEDDHQLFESLAAALADLYIRRTKVSNHHERFGAATPEQVAALVADFEGIWPTQIAPAPRLKGHRLYKAGTMLWQEFDRPSAARAFRVISPAGLQAEHWFEVEPVGAGSLLRHRIEGEAVGECEAIWRDQIEPMHDLVLEALLDKVKGAVAHTDRSTAG